MNHTRACYGSLVAALLCAMPLSAASRQLTVTVAAEKHDRINTLVRATVELPAEFKDVTTVVLSGPGASDQATAAQLTPPTLLDKAKQAGGTVTRNLYFILPRLKAGQSATYRATIATSSTSSSPGFAWHDTPGEYTELRHGRRPVLRYMYKKLDDSSKKSRELTYKVYHHLYDPTGSHLVTKGPGGRYTHHRGLFYGFNRVSYAGGKKRADVWHCGGDAHQSHQEFLASDAGPVLGRHRLKVHWHGPGKEVFAQEQREMTVYHVPGGQLVEFASRLASNVGPLKLDGDPQHAGFQFRASNEVAAKTAKQTYYLRPDGQGQPGQTRNWDAKRRDPKCVNLPWNAMSFVLGDERYTAVYLDKPTNPKEARYSERDYGRFGSYFEYELDEGKDLEVNYRVWLQQGELTREDAARLSQDFVDPVKVTVSAAE